MDSLSECRIAHVGFSSSPEEWRINHSYYDECVDRFADVKDVSCDIDVFEQWKKNAKKTDRALIIVSQIVSFGGDPVEKCRVRLVFRPGRLLSEKIEREKEIQKIDDELFNAIGPP